MTGYEQQYYNDIREIKQHLSKIAEIEINRLEIEKERLKIEQERLGIENDKIRISAGNSMGFVR